MEHERNAGANAGNSAVRSLRTRRDIENFFEQLGERSVRMALQSRMRFPMPFGEYHAAMWLAGRERQRRERARHRDTLQFTRTLDSVDASAEILERGARFAAGAALVFLVALAYEGLKS
jgi:hypothetical protein